MRPTPTVLARLTCGIVLALGLAGCGSEGVDGNAAANQAKCRAAYADTSQAIGENGSPAEPGSVLDHRYEALDAEISGLAKTATGADCPKRIGALKNDLGAVNDLAVASRQYDMRIQLASAEGDLRHAIRTRDYDPLPTKLAALFGTLRTQAPIAHDEMKAALDNAANAPLTRAAVTAAKADLKAAVANSPAYAKCLTALAGISEYELDEE